MRLYEIKQNISNVAAYRYLIELSILNEIEKSKLDWISEQSSDREESIKKRRQNPESLRSSKVEFRAKEIARNQESEKIVSRQVFDMGFEPNILQVPKLIRRFSEHS